MPHGHAPELLGRGDVAMGGEPRQAVCVDSAESQFSWIDTAFRLCRAHWLAALSLNRVQAAEGSSFVRAGVSRDLDRDSLQVGRSSAACQQRDGNG